MARHFNLTYFLQSNQSLNIVHMILYLIADGNRGETGLLIKYPAIPGDKERKGNGI